jgi:hypothetical protein
MTAAAGEPENKKTASPATDPAIRLRVTKA